MGRHDSLARRWGSMRWSRNDHQYRRASYGALQRARSEPRVLRAGKRRHSRRQAHGDRLNRLVRFRSHSAASLRAPVVIVISASGAGRSHPQVRTAGRRSARVMGSGATHWIPPPTVRTAPSDRTIIVHPHRRAVDRCWFESQEFADPTLSFAVSSDLEAQTAASDCGKVNCLFGSEGRPVNFLCMRNLAWLILS